MPASFGPIAMLGSGETSLAGGRVFETLARRYSPPLHIALLETPAGFELNSQKVASRVGDFLKNRLAEFDPQIAVIPARKRDTPFSPDDPEILQPLLYADIVFMGPGSPTYAIRQLEDSLAWHLVRLRHRLGASLVLASAAVISVGDFALPVYEIYKVGEEVKLFPGLKFFTDFNLHLSFLPHWNNTDGGDELDTSRCYIGVERFNQWLGLLPSDQTVIGLDEQTGIVIDFNLGRCAVMGVSSVSLWKQGEYEIFASGATFPLTRLGEIRLPAQLETGIPTIAMEMVLKDNQGCGQMEVPPKVLRLMEERKKARNNQDWQTADSLRSQLAALGWIIQDTQNGQRIIRHV